MHAHAACVFCILMAIFFSFLPFGSIQLLRHAKIYVFDTPPPHHASSRLKLIISSVTSRFLNRPPPALSNRKITKPVLNTKLSHFGDFKRLLLTQKLRWAHFYTLNNTFTNIPLLGSYWSISPIFHFLQQAHRCPQHYPQNYIINCMSFQLLESHDVE